MALTKVSSGLISADASSVDLNIDAGTLYLDATNNRVGIGTDSPSNKLSIVDSGSTTLEINGQGRVSSLTLGVTASESKLFEGSNNDLAFGTNATERMRIDSSGRVGIGTSDIEETVTIAKHDGGDGVVLGLRSDASFSQFEIKTSNSQLDWGLSAVGGRSLTFDTNGSERMRIDSSGNVGIGLTPAEKLEVFGNIKANAANDKGFLLGGNCAILRQDSTEMGFETNGSEAMRIDGSGNVGIGTTDPQSMLELDRSTNGFNELRLTNGRYNTNGIGFAISARGYQNVEAGRIEFLRRALWNETSNSKDSDMVFFTTLNGTSAETMRITSGNLLQVGTTTTTDGRINATTLSGKYALALNDTFGNNALAQFLDNGSQVGSITISGSNTVYNTSSDSRLKENIVDADSQLETINNIKIREFDWIKDGKHQVGVIAQELEEVYPDAVTVGGEDIEKNPYSVDYSKLVAPLIKAVQEQQEQIESLKSRIEILEANNG